MKRTVLYIHQSAELYGSDKTLSFLVNQINIKHNFKSIVVLPDFGPLKDLLEENGVEVIIFPVIKLSRGFLNAKSILKLPKK